MRQLDWMMFLNHRQHLYEAVGLDDVLSICMRQLDWMMFSSSPVV